MKQPKLSQNPKKTKQKGTKVAKVGDLISAPATIFDNEPGSFSNKHPERCFGAGEAVSEIGLGRVRRVEDNTVNGCKIRDLTVEKCKMDVNEIILMLVEDNKLMFVPKHKVAGPKDLFVVLVRFEWRKMIEAVKAEIQGWLDSDAVEIVMFKDVPASAKVIPLENYIPSNVMVDTYFVNT
jgi:hypothetical protein